MNLRPYICSMSRTGPLLNCSSFSAHAEILFLFVTMYVFRAECKSKQVLVLLLLCGKEDVHCCSHLVGWWKERVRTQQDRGGGPRLWEDLITLLEAGAVSQAVGNGGGEKATGTRHRNWVREMCGVSLWKMINRTPCWAQRGECSSDLIRADEANYYSQKNRTIHTGVFHNKLHPTMHDEKIWNNQILNRCSNYMTIYVGFFCKKKV